MAACSSRKDVLFEKVLRLKEILTYLNTDEYLYEHLALKGGTAINCFNDKMRAVIKIT